MDTVVKRLRPQAGGAPAAVLELGTGTTCGPGLP
jgi:hypothetical protein